MYDISLKEKVVNHLLYKNGNVRADLLYKEHDICEEVFNATNFLPEKTPLKHRIFIVLHDIEKIPTCQVCDNPVYIYTQLQKHRGVFSLVCSDKCQIIRQQRSLILSYNPNLWGIIEQKIGRPLSLEKDLWNEVNKLTDFLPKNTSLRGRVRCIMKDITKTPICKICGNPVPWNDNHLSFPDHCSKSCINNDPDIRKKMDTSKKVNNSYNTSSMEEEAHKFLLEEFKIIKKQYKDLIRYPFNCDFYIPDLDLFIEINAFWTHGGEPFNSNNPLHEEKLNLWKNKYNEGIENVWTKYDVDKFNHASLHNLNYSAIYNWRNKDDFIKQVYRGMSTPSYNNTSLNLDYSIKSMEKELQQIISKDGDIGSHYYSNKIVLMFQKHFYNKERELWNDLSIQDKLLTNREKYLGKPRSKLTNQEILRGFKISGIHYGYSHFNPLWEKYFIDKYNIHSIYDPCGGWGHRLLGAWNIDYIYNDSDKRSVQGARNIWSFFKGNNKSIKIFFNKDAGSFTPGLYYDAVFTCPPYFDKETYSGDLDSVKLYPAYEDWLNIWWYNLVKKSLQHCKKYFSFIISNDLKDDMKSICNKFDLELIEDAVVSPIKRKSHFQKKRNNFEYLVVYKRNTFLDIPKNKSIKCFICNQLVKSYQGLLKHLTMSHPEVSKQYYYESYISEQLAPICPYCNKRPRLFKTLKGDINYWQTCGYKECIIKSNKSKYA